MSAADDIHGSTVIGAMPGETHVDRALLGEVLDRIATLGHGSGLEASLAIADAVLERLFDGSILAFRAASRRHETFRALQAHPRLGMSKSALWYAIAVREQMDVLPAPIAQALPLSHHKVLLAVESPNEKVALACRARRENLSRRDLERIVRHQTPARVVRGPGRPPTPAVLKGLLRLAQATHLAKSEPLSPRDLRRHDREGLSGLLEALDRNLTALDVLRRDLERLSRER